MFLNLFNEMKNAKIPVSLREYLTLLEALTAGVAIFDVNDFYYLARSTLVKDERHIDRFDQVFSRVFKGLEAIEIEEIFKKIEIPHEWIKKLAEKTLSKEEIDLSRATPPPGTIPSSTAALVACSASSTRAYFSFISSIYFFFL